MADLAALSIAFMRSHPAEAARVLEGASTAASVDLLNRAPARIGATVLAQMLSRAAADVVTEMTTERAFELLAHLDAQRAAAILRHVTAGERSRLLSGLPTTTAITAKLLLEFIDDSVGSCMNPDVIALHGGESVDAALDRVRNAHVATECIYVVDDARRLLGFATLAAAMRAPARARLESLMQPIATTLPAHAPLAGAQSHPGWRTASMLPVVDRHDRLLGEISRDRLESAIHRAHPSDVADTSFGAVLVHGYWQSMSGILDLLLTLLPTSRPIGGARDER